MVQIANRDENGNLLLTFPTQTQKFSKPHVGKYTILYELGLSSQK